MANGTVGAMEITDENLAGIEQPSALIEKQLTGVPSGFPNFDRLANGLQPGDLIVLAALAVRA